MWRCGPTRAVASPFLTFLDHTMKHHSRQDSSRRVISSSQRTPPDYMQHSQQKNIHNRTGIRNQFPAREQQQSQVLDRAFIGTGKPNSLKHVCQNFMKSKCTDLFKNCDSCLEALACQFILKTEQFLQPYVGSQHAGFTTGSDQSWPLSSDHWSINESSHLQPVILTLDYTLTDAAKQ